MHIVRNTAQNKLGDGGIMCAIFVKSIFQVSNILRPRSSRVSRTATTHTLRTHTVVGRSAKRCTLLQTMHVHVMRVGTLAVISASVSPSFPKKGKKRKTKAHAQKTTISFTHCICTDYWCGYDGGTDFMDLSLESNQLPPNA